MRFLLPLLLLVACQSSTGPDCHVVQPIPFTIVLVDPNVEVAGSHPCIDLTVEDVNGNLLEFIPATEPCGCL